MKTLLGVLVLAALSQAMPLALKQGHRYVYHYRSDVIHAIPGGAQKQLGLRLQCHCHVDMIKANEAQVTLAGIQVQQLEITTREIPRRILAIAEAVAELQRPVEAVFTKSGLIGEIRATRKDPEWSLNIKRGILNLLQVAPKIGTLDPKLVLTGIIPRIFTRKERTVVGICPVVYTIIPELHKRRGKVAARHIAKVTKIINYRRCLFRPQIKESSFLGKVCLSCRKSLGFAPYLRHTGKIHHTLVNRFLLKATAEETHVLTPFSELGGQVVVTARQHLIFRTKVLSKARALKVFVRTGLVFRPVHPETIARQNMKYQQQCKAKVLRLIQRLRIIVVVQKQITHHMVPQIITEVIMNLRMLRIPALRHLMRIVLQQRNEKLRELLIDAVSLAGTEEVAAVLKMMVMQKVPQLPLRYLNRILFNLPFTPRLGMMHFVAVNAICKHKLLLKPANLAIRRQCFLSFGALVNRLMHDHRLRQRVPIQAAIRNAVNTLNNGLVTAKTLQEKIMFVKAIGNAGHPGCQKRVMMHLLNRRLSTVLRVECVWALRKMVHLNLNDVVRKALRIFINPRNNAELRMAVVELLLDKLPTFQHMQIMVNTIRREVTGKGPRCNQVASWVISKLSSMAYYDNTILKDRAMRARLALRSAPWIIFGLGFSKAVRVAMFFDKFQTGIDLEVNKMNVPQSYIPRNMNMRLRLHVMGFKMNLAEIGARVEGLQDVIQDVVSEIRLRQKRSMWTSLWNSFMSSEPTVGPNDEPEPTEEPGVAPTESSNAKAARSEVSMFLKLFEQELLFARVTPKEVKQLADQVIRLLQGKQQQVQTAFGAVILTKNKLIIKKELTKAFVPVHLRQILPTLTGLPIMLHLVKCMVSHVAADVHIEVKPSLFGFLRATSFKTKVFLKPRVAVHVQGKVIVHNPFVRVGLMLKTNILMRPTIKFNLDGHTNKQYTFKMATPTKRQDILMITPNPVQRAKQAVFGIVEVQTVKRWMIRRRAVNMLLRKEHLAIVKPVCFGKNVFGVQACMAGQVPKLAALRLRGVPVFPTVFMTRLHVFAAPCLDAAKDIAITAKVLAFNARHMIAEANIIASGKRIQRRVTMGIKFLFQTRRLIIQTKAVMVPGLSAKWFLQVIGDIRALRSWDFQIIFGEKGGINQHRITVRGRIEPLQRKKITLTCAWNRLPGWLHKVITKFEPEILYYLQTIATISRLERKPGHDKMLEIIVRLLTPLATQVMAQTPIGHVQTKVMALPVAIRQLPLSWQEVRDWTTGVCRVHRRTVEIFDKQSYQLNLKPSHCLHVLAEDKKKQVFRVAIQEHIAGRKALVIQIHRPHKIVIHVKPDLTVLVNSRRCQKTVCEVHNVAKVVKIGQTIKVIVTTKYAFEVLYQPHKIEIKAGVTLMDRVRGLCGDFNGEQYNEFKSPQGMVLGSVEQFAKSWRIQC